MTLLVYTLLDWSERQNKSISNEYFQLKRQLQCRVMEYARESVPEKDSKLTHQTKQDPFSGFKSETTNQFFLLFFLGITDNKAHGCSSNSSC